MTRTRARRRKRSSVDHGLIITSMVDMFTLVLLFLLVFYDPAYQGDSELELPVAASQAAAESGPTVRVSPAGIEVAGRVVAALPGGALEPSVAREGKAVVPVVESLRRLRELSEGGGTTDEPPVLIVECDKRVSWSVLGAVLESGSRAGFPRYRFLVLSGQ